MWQTRAAAVILVTGIVGASLFAQQPPAIASMDAAIALLEADAPERTDEALAYVLTNLDMARADVLLMAAMGALGSARIEDAGFLFYAGQLRSRVDQQRFPPVGEGGSSPAIAIGALQQIIGAEINPAVMREPATLAAVLDRLDAWDAETAGDYDPGWTYGKALPAAEARKVTETAKAEYLRGGRAVLSLITIPEYLAALRESEDATAGDLSDETKLNAALERHRVAQERMCAIEKQLNVKGLCDNEPQ